MSTSGLFAAQTPAPHAIPVSDGSGMLDPAFLMPFSVPARCAHYTVAMLPTAASFPYALAFVTDATLTAITGLGLPPIGGGPNIVPVFSDGTGWFIL